MSHIVVTQVNMNFASPTVYNTISGNTVVMNSNEPITIDITLEMSQDMAEKFKTLEDIEDLLNSQHAWASKTDIEDALREKYPERFL